MARELAPKLFVIFRHLVKKNSFPTCWPTFSLFQRNLLSWILLPSSITTVLSKVFEKTVAGKFSHFLECSSRLPPSKFSHRRGLGTCVDLLTLSHHLQVALDRGIQVGLFNWTSQLNLIELVTAVCCISWGLYVLEDSSCQQYRSFLVIEGSACVWMIRSARQLLWFRKCPTAAFYSRCYLYYTPPISSTLIVNNIVSYADDTAVYAVILSLLSRPQLRERAESGFDIDQFFVYEVAHEVQPYRKTKSVVVILSRTIASGYGDLTLESSPHTYRFVVQTSGLSTVWQSQSASHGIDLSHRHQSSTSKRVCTSVCR